jgi:hypothetical protein
MIIFNDNGTAQSFEYDGCDFSDVAVKDAGDCVNQTSLNFVEGDSGINM